MNQLNYQQKAKEIVHWLRNTVTDAGFNRVVIGVSGGVDSATSLNLAVKAFGAENVYALLMPYGTLGTQALSDGKLVARSAGLEKDHIVVRDIKKATDRIWSVVSKASERSPQEISLTQPISDIQDAPVRVPQGMQHQDRNDNERSIDTIRKGNIMARLRMIFLYDISKELNALVVGTENLTEHYLGYFTRFGDEASDVEPIRNLYKTQVWEMAKYLGVPQQIIDKAPSANLWEGQSDEGEFGFSYSNADRILYHHFQEGLPVEGIVSLGFDTKLVENVLQFVAKNDFKHHLPKVY